MSITVAREQLQGHAESIFVEALSIFNPFKLYAKLLDKCVYENMGRIDQVIDLELRGQRVPK